MSGFEWIDKMPILVRWILFLPSILIVYFILRIFAAFSIGYGIGPENDGLISFLSYKFYYNFICVGASLMISCLIVPKGRIIVASIYLGIVLILTGMGLNNLLNNVTYSEPLWRIIYETLTTIGGYIFALVLIIKNEKEMNKAPEGAHSM